MHVTRLESLTAAPYDLDLVDYLDKYVCAWKVGSGDIDWLEMIKKLASKNKPLLMATGASTLGDVIGAYQLQKAYRPNSNHAM